MSYYSQSTSTRKKTRAEVFGSWKIKSSPSISPNKKVIFDATNEANLVELLPYLSDSEIECLYKFLKKPSISASSTVLSKNYLCRKRMLEIKELEAELYKRKEQCPKLTGNSTKEAGNRGERDVLFRLRHLDPNEFLILNYQPLKLFSPEMILVHEFDFLVLNVKRRIIYNIECKNYKGTVSEKQGIWKHNLNIIQPMYEQLDFQSCLLGNILR